ncbi:hypothetical protein DRO26_03655 [Candidatus Bathyarchaeota archaeon]|nr:MAG: hypothetical protein DRO26_03655 [Candidatus Bathyarchaeota archaeon]
MKLQKILENVYLVDLEPSIENFEKFIASYIVLGEKVAIIETGPRCSVEGILEALDKIGVGLEEVDYVAVSHIHLDHAGGVGTLLKKLPNAKLVVHEKGVFHMSNPTKLWESSKQVLGWLAEKYGELEPVPSEKILVGKDGLKIDLGKNIKIDVLETPGHASHHLSFFNQEGGVLFVGEVGGIYSEEFNIVRPSTPPPSFDPIQNFRSIDRLVNLNPKILCYSHFGVTKEIQKLSIYKDRLKLWLRIVAEEYKQKSVEEIFEKILEEDRNVRPIANLWRERFFMLNSVKGMVYYLERHGLPSSWDK